MSGVLDRVFLVMFVQQLPAFFCVGAVPRFSQEYLCFRKETNNGLYEPLCYFIADSLVNIPFWFVLSFTSILPAFALLGMNWQHFFQIWLLVALFVGWIDTAAQLCGTLLRSTAVAIMIFIMNTIVNMIFCGLMLSQKDDVVWFLQWIYHVVPSKYSFRTHVLLEFKGLEFTGFELANNRLGALVKDRSVMQALGPLAPALKLLVPANSGNGAAMKVDGVDIVEALQASMFPVLTTDDTFCNDLTVIFVELVLLKVIHLYAVHRQAA